MAGHAVEGLVNWLRRDEWRTAFEDLMDEHLRRGVRGDRLLS